MGAVDNIQNSINKAVDTIVKRRIEQLELDKTILAIIDSNEGFVHGQKIYRLKYNGGYFSASARNGEQYYSGMAVYVLIPQGDFSKDKFIISRASTKATGQQQAVSIATASDYGIVGKNIVETTEKYPEPYGVRSYHDPKSEERQTDESDEAYAIRKQALVSHRYNFLYQDGSNTNKVKVNNNDILKFKDEATAVMLKADFLTSLTSEQRSSAIGEYGLAINLIFKNLAAGYGDIWGEVFNNFASIIRLPQDNPENASDIEWGTRTLQDLDEEICEVIGVDKEDINNIRWDKEQNTSLAIIGEGNLIDQKLNELKSNIQLFYDRYEGTISTMMRTLVSNYIQTLEDMIVQTNIENARAVYEEWWKSETGAQEANKIVTYYLTSSDMIGNPFSFTSWTNQYSVFSIDLENFLGIDSILFYKRGFNVSETKENKLIEPNDIQVKNVQFYLMKPIADYNGQYQLKVEADENGMVFKSKTEPIDGITVYATLLREMYEDLTKNARTLIYWFIEDAAVSDRTKKGFREYAGLGWRVLNDSSDYVLNQEYWKISFDDTPAYENHFRCVAVYDGQEDQVVLRYDFTIYNNARQQFVLESDLGTNFGFDAGKPTLTIYRVDKNDEANPYKSLEQGKYRCEWTLLYQDQTIFFSESSNNIFGMGEGLTGEIISRMPSTTSLLKNIETYTYDSQNNQYIKSEILNQTSQIRYPMANVAAESKVTFEAFISEKEENSNSYNFVGKVILTLSNSGAGNVNNYRLVIENGDQVFQYNEYGSAPKEGEFKDKQKILPLKAVVYSPANIAITEQNFQTKWIFPADQKRTLIVYEGGKYDAGTQAANTFTGQQVTFDINDYYDYNKMDNQILCQVQFGDKLLEAKTNFLFTKVGNNGTNGTEVVGKISPKIDIMKLREQPVTILTYYDKEGNKLGFLNYNGPGTASDRIQITKTDQSYNLLAFVAQLYQKSDPLAIDDLKWNIAGNLRTKVNINGKDFSVEDNEIVWTGEENSESNNYYHQYIIEAEMRNGDNLYYAFQGIPVINYNITPSALWKNRIGIENDSYLKEIVYNSDGRNPLYNAYQGVKLTNLPLGEKTEGDNSIASEGWIIHWSAIGGYNASESMPMFSLLLSPEADKKTAVKDFWTAKNDMVYILPNDEISGNITNNNVKAEVYVGDPNKLESFIHEQSELSSFFDLFYNEAITNERSLLSGLSNKWKELLDTFNSSLDLDEIEIKERTFDDNKKALVGINSEDENSLEYRYTKAKDEKEEAKNTYETVKAQHDNNEDNDEVRIAKDNFEKKEQEVQNLISAINNLEWANEEIPIETKYRMKNLLKSLQKICQNFISWELAKYLPTENVKRPIEFAYWSDGLLNDNEEVIIQFNDIPDTVEDIYKARTEKRKQIIYQKIIKVFDLGVTLVRQDFYTRYAQAFGDKTNKNKLIVLNKIFDLTENWISNNAIQAWINFCSKLKDFDSLNNEELKNKIKEDFKTDFKENGTFVQILNNSFSDGDLIINKCKSVIITSLNNFLEEYFLKAENTETIKADTWDAFVKVINEQKEKKYNDYQLEAAYKKEQSETVNSNALVPSNSIIDSEDVDNARTEETDNFLEEKTEEEIKKEKWNFYYKDLIENIRIEFNRIFSRFFSKMIGSEEYQTLRKENEFPFSLIATVYAPIHMSLNTFGLASLNGWDGTHITMNEEDGYFLAPQVGAGFKDNNNRFTGILMGKAGQYGDKEEQHTTGLFGYSAGMQSIFLDAETGNATFGLPSLKDENGKELDYVEYYDGDERQIRDSYNEGQIKLIPGGVSTIGGWRFGQQSLYYTDSKEIGSGYRTDYVPDLKTGEIRLLENYHSNHVKDINHNDSGILLHSGKNPYISIKGRVLTEDDIALTKNNNNLIAGDSLEVQLEPNTPTLFTIMRHNGINRGSPNTRTYLAGINSKGELVANVVGSSVSAKDDGTEGKTTTLTTQGISAFKDYVTPSSTEELVMSYVGINSNLANNSIVRLFVLNAGDRGTENLYISGGGYGTTEYARPISMHGRKIALFTAQEASLKTLTEENKDHGIDINVSTETDSGIILEPEQIKMTLPHLTNFWDYTPSNPITRHVYKESHAVELLLSNKQKNHLKLLADNSAFNLEVQNNIEIKSNTGNIAVKTPILADNSYTNTTGTYIANASNSITLKKGSTSSIFIGEESSTEEIKMVRNKANLILKDTNLETNLPGKSGSEYKTNVGESFIRLKDYMDQESTPTLINTAGNDGNFNVVVSDGGDGPAALSLSANNYNYAGPNGTNRTSYPFFVQLSGTAGSLGVSVTSHGKTTSSEVDSSVFTLDKMSQWIKAGGLSVDGIYKSGTETSSWGLMVKEDTNLKKGLYVGSTLTTGPKDGEIKADKSIEAGTSIKAGTSITAGTWIKAETSITAGTTITAPGAESYKFASQDTITASGTKHGNYQTQRTADGETLEELIQDCLSVAASAYNKANEAKDTADAVSTKLNTFITNTYNKHTHTFSVTNKSYPVTLSVSAEEAKGMVSLTGSYGTAKYVPDKDGLYRKEGGSPGIISEDDASWSRDDSGEPLTEISVSAAGKSNQKVSDNVEVTLSGTSGGPRAAGTNDNGTPN